MISEDRQDSRPTRGSRERTEFLAGAVFCGGQSRRMGTDKAGLMLGGVTLLERATGVLAPRVERLVLACGSADRFPGSEFPRVFDRVAGGGPLAGLEAALADLLWAGGGWLLVLACDAPGVPGPLYDRLIEEAEHGSADAVLARRGEILEPLVAAYHTRVLPAVTSALEAGERRLVSFHRGHGSVRLATLEVRDDDLSNVNTPEEYRALVARIPGGECA